ncbi:MAG: DUF4271 domain-containing protein [Flavobacterium sp.]|jgi:hypothetical protein|uniref:DUF4271 domain-containing protein n=1 Tax=Flavobacterium sp. TaxID=239 RepID=UPI0022CA86C9|nr:DUF4271 domain-containing protein [Flavobacterium sp.]MCZ8168571.1 DUF4271 domain-containing protein [Flavobacterium sp.]MCZ8297313.1 DUF4271 domain-containing protein [Flavobacterium sp.]
MIACEFQPRIVSPFDWATLIFVVALGLVVIARTAFESRFNDYIRLLVSDKYTKIYRESSHLWSGFNIVLFVVHLISLSFFIQIVLAHNGWGEKTDWLLFVRIFTGLFVFILSKFLIEKIIAVTFDVEELIDEFNLQKVNFRTYIGLLLFPVSMILFYGDFTTNTLISVIIITILVTNLLTYLFSLKNHQNIVTGKLFYFILYLCALEIAPYYFIYYLITKN